MTPAEILGYFACQSDASDPREHAPLFHGLSGSVGAFCRTIHPQAELVEADVSAERLTDIQISPSEMWPGGRLTVRVTEA